MQIKFDRISVQGGAPCHAWPVKITQLLPGDAPPLGFRGPRSQLENSCSTGTSVSSRLARSLTRTVPLAHSSGATSTRRAASGKGVGGGVHDVRWSQGPLGPLVCRLAPVCLKAHPPTHPSARPQKAPKHTCAAALCLLEGPLELFGLQHKVHPAPSLPQALRNAGGGRP